VARHGQQIWLDKLSRSLVANGELVRWVEQHHVAGVTSNPAIFAQALSTDPAYAPALQLLRTQEASLERRFERVAIPDVQAACDILRALYERSDGEAGYVSFEVSPKLSHDCQGTLAAARRETNSWRWPVFMFVYLMGLAYVAAFVTYRVAVALGGG